MIFTRYLFRNLLFATLFTAVTLAGIVMLTQSIRFLELIVESGASSLSFWIVTFLALPRFFEIAHRGFFNGVRLCPCAARFGRER